MLNVDRDVLFSEVPEAHDGVPVASVVGARRPRPTSTSSPSVVRSVRAQRPQQQQGAGNFLPRPSIEGKADYDAIQLMMSPAAGVKKSTGQVSVTLD